jgi:hypothetical protein
MSFADQRGVEVAPAGARRTGVARRVQRLFFEAYRDVFRGPASCAQAPRGPQNSALYQGKHRPPPLAVGIARGRRGDFRSGHFGSVRCVGEFRKTRHPRNVEFNKVLKACFSGAGNSRFSEVWDLRSLEFVDMQSSGILIR